MSDVQLEIQKRHTLNWLIQGASEHAGMTFHHLVRDELNSLEPELLSLYDRFAVLGQIQYWQRDAIILGGWPPRFWRRATSKRDHPFFGHPLLAQYGGMLAETGRQRALDRGKEKGLKRYPMSFSFQTVSCITRLRKLEAPHRMRLVQLAKEATSTVWGIPCERLHGELTDRIVLQEGELVARSFRESLMRLCVMGIGRVMRHGGEFQIVARGTNWLILAKELVKGTAELICLHGLNRIDDARYRRVLEATDRLDLEPWLLQSGGELWRRLLVALPDDQPVAKVLMRLALLPPATLQTVIATVIEQPERASDRIASLVE
jgi:hypothetical protein